MKKILLLAGFFALSVLTAAAQVGSPYIHDPSTIAECDGKYYTFGTGGGGLISADGWVWKSGAVRPGRGAAPDVIKIGDRYLVGYSSTGGGFNGPHAGTILTMWNKTLDPNSPDFAYTEPIEVARTVDDEDCDAIDVSFLLGPDGRLFCSYGTYFGFIRLVELDPATGARLAGNQPVDIAIDCEATALVYRDGWYYLLATHGTCCDGINSTYNIVVGRSRSVTGPYLDNVGRDMLRGGGRMVIAAQERLFGAGHFGRFVVEEGVEKMSLHFEGDLDRSGLSVLAIRPLLWKDGWPEAGELIEDGTYKILSRRRGYSLELSVDFVRAQGGIPFWQRKDGDPVQVLEGQKLSDVIGGWPKGVIPVRMADYMARPHQKWTIEAVPGAGGYLGGPYYRIVIEGTERALAAAEGARLETVPAFTGADRELWRIDQLTDGTYRIMPKEIPGQAGDDGSLCLVSIADSTPGLGRFDFGSDNCKWDLKRLFGKPEAGTFENRGNPLIRNRYTADPAPMVASDGRLYLFCGHDEQFDDKPGYEGKYGFNITEWVCYSTADMKTWKDHGVVMKPTDFSWAVGEAWASQCIEVDGKYYFYVSCQSGDPDCKAIGVAVADRPEGPYQDAIGKALILDDMTPNGLRGWWNDFDPTVMIDDDGTPWLCWGNGTCFLAPLKKNMVELAGDIRVLPMENYVEGPWLYKRNGHYYNVYASMGQGKETISYAMAPSVEGPWEFKGELSGMAKDSFTIHPGVIDFKGRSYLFYHNSTLSLGGYGPATGRRSVCVDELRYNADGTLQYVEQTPEGIAKDFLSL